jgi:serine/threonine protein kinase
MDAAPVKQGDVLAGKYRVERVLGIGGMGVVVAATHLELLELRALKFMLPSSLQSGEAVERFLREARAAARLRNEHVAKVHDVGRLENGAPYMVMEYLEGSDLDALLKREGPLPPAVAALYAIQVCEALSEAHSLGIIHRDLKPSNLFLTRRLDGTASIKVLDFGISKLLGTGPDFEMTKTETVLGSPMYMSPEQMRSARSVDARSDIWSLGVMLYKLTTGKLPFPAENITELVLKILETVPAAPSTLQREVSPAFDAIILRCLRRIRDERYPNVAALAAALVPLAPPGASAPIESMSRILASSSASVRAVSDVHSTSAAPPITEGQTPARASGPQTEASAFEAPAAPGRGAERTNNSWEGGSPPRQRTRLGATLLLGGIGGALALAVILGVVFLSPSSPPPVASGATVGATIAAPTHEPLLAPSSAPSAPPVVAVPASSAGPASSERPSAGKHPSGKPAAEVSSSGVDPRAKPASSGRGVRSPDGVDPFGTGRK